MEHWVMKDAREQAIAIKKAACRDWYLASRDAALGLDATDIGSATAFSCTGVDSLMLNRCLGLGSSPASKAETERVLDYYRRRGVERFFVHVTPGPSHDVVSGASSLHHQPMGPIVGADPGTRGGPS